MKILESIKKNTDLKKLDKGRIEQLCKEIREFLVENVSKTGGHLASNLGVVELTIALHRIFDLPLDKIVWDVGHQSYVHKILTGRRDRFSTLRQFGGLSGFPKPDESEYDTFVTGHSSTSISAALGIARARDIKKEKYHVISVIGDGALSGGMAFEALNDAGSAKTNLIVILNDNEMSISQNVGSLSAYLGRIRTNPKYINFRDDVEIMVKKIPTIGNALFQNTHRLKESLKSFFIQGMLFEELGFKYIGPIDGHSIEKLEDALARAKKINGPVMIHVITKKGKGYLHAENQPDIFHGVGPFEIKTGEKTSITSQSYSSVFGEELIQAANKDPRIVGVTAAMPDGTGLAEFAESFKDRFFDVGIAEQHAVTMAAGLAANGMKPVFAVYSTFLQRAYDQVVHDICIQKLPVMFAIDRAGIVGEDGETHQGILDLSYLRAIPNMTILSPKNIGEFRKMLKWCFAFQGPVAIRYPRGNDIEVGFAEEEGTTDIEFGKWETLKKGKHAAILSVGKMNQIAKKVANKLSSEGIEIELVNCRFVKPMDLELLDAILDKFDLVVTLEDNYKAAGFGSQVLEQAAESHYKGQISVLGYPDEFIVHGSVNKLYEKYGLDEEGIYCHIRALIEE